MDRAEERAGPEDVGDQALMRGLVTAFPLFVWGCPCLRSGVDHLIGHVDSSGVPLAGGPALAAARLCLAGDPFCGLQRRGPGPVEPSWLKRSKVLDHVTSIDLP